VALLLASGAQASATLSGLAVAPDGYDWHGGRVYAADAGGTLFAVSALTGAVAATPSAAAGACRPLGTCTVPGAALGPPVLVPNAWGADNNALIVVATGSAANASASSSSVSAFAVGNNGASGDDDAADDDGYASLVSPWQFTLPADVGAVTARGGPAVLVDGRVALVSAAGELVVVGRAHGAVDLDSPLLYLITGGCVGFGVVLAVGGFAYARARRRQARLAEEAEAAAAEEEEEEAERARQHERLLGDDPLVAVDSDPTHPALRKD
jgi:hypothetical protein